MHLVSAIIVGSSSDSESLSAVIGKKSPLQYNNSSEDDDDVKFSCGKKRRLNVTERYKNVSNKMAKYCPICSYKTDDNKLTRHIGIKHEKCLKYPANRSLKKIGMTLGKESRRSISLVLMSNIKEKMGPYWGDVSFRRIAFQLCVI
ncbi:unnamed protein product [Macrosiphum euphorbiae]|uniref:BED-type domain-containing protein n=1 Tax=Macrosiphum euphorbiae TaxID=13131 RepID=A0AAV0XSC9_9HEMI|nr:unnamed protein product [Macrosiphum euphorbiae]